MGKKKLSFKIEPRAGVNMVVWFDGKCRPATDIEIEIWNLFASTHDYRHSKVIETTETEAEES